MIIGHQKQLQFLRYMVQAGQLPHALLFSGEEQLGKRAIAVELVKMLHCQTSRVKACQKCPACSAIVRGVYGDLFLVEPQDDEAIKIDQVRDIGNFLSLRSASGKPRVVIIDNAHRMTIPAQQAFLKTLEEPRGAAVIVLISSRPHLLLPTVLSRVQQLKFFPVSEQELSFFLKMKGISENVAKDVIKLSFRKPGAAVEFLKNEKTRKFRASAFKEIQRLCRADLSERFKWASLLAKEPAKISEILELWLRFFRGLVIMKLRGQVTNRKFVMEPGESGRSVAFPDYSLERLQRIVTTLQEVDSAISSSNVNPRLALDVVMLEL